MLFTMTVSSNFKMIWYELNLAQNVKFISNLKRIALNNGGMTVEITGLLLLNEITQVVIHIEENGFRKTFSNYYAQ